MRVTEMGLDYGTFPSYVVIVGGRRVAIKSSEIRRKIMNAKRQVIGEYWSCLDDQDVPIKLRRLKTDWTVYN